LNLVTEALLEKAKKNTAKASVMKDKALEAENKELMENTTQNVLNNMSEKKGGGGGGFTKFIKAIKEYFLSVKGILGAAAKVTVAVGVVAVAISAAIA
jgi:hypothetical protein